MNAVIEYHNEVGAIEPDQWLTARLKKKQLAATLRLMHFANNVLFNRFIFNRGVRSGSLARFAAITATRSSLASWSPLSITTRKRN